MTTNAQVYAEECLDIWRRTSSGNEHYAAVSNLAEARAISLWLPEETRSALTNAVDSCDLTTGLVHGARSGMVKETERVERILSIGTEWVDDEILLVISIRIQLEEIRTLLVSRGFSVDQEILDRCDTAFREVLMYPSVQAHCRSSIQLIEKNAPWSAGLPLLKSLRDSLSE